MEVEVAILAGVLIGLFLIVSTDPKATGLLTGVVLALLARFAVPAELAAADLTY